MSRVPTLHSERLAPHRPVKVLIQQESPGHNHPEDAEDTDHHERNRRDEDHSPGPFARVSDRPNSSSKSSRMSW